DMIGDTPLVEISRLNPNKNVKVFAKLESCNPGGSIKDRTALFMIERALKRGELTREKTILEATSGNTGIGLALVAAAMGYSITLVLSESVSEERKKILRALGASLLLTPAHHGTDGAIELVYEMLREHPDKYFVPDQHNNEDNTLAHYHGTAEEIWQQTGHKVSAVVTTLGTSGTAMGISKRLKEYNGNIKIIGVEPYLRHKIQGLKNMKESYRPGIFDKSRLDEKVNILDEDAFEMARNLAREEGIMAGMSSGAAMHVALEKAREMTGGVIVVIFPDGGERYLSTELYAGKKETTVRLYNTLTKTKEFFKPINSEEILIHSCGPTVHEVPHIGTYRRVIVSDMIVRYLNFKGYEVKHVTNIIDMADRSIKGAELAGVDVKEFSERYTKVFYEDLDKLNIRHDSNYPRASENVEEMIRLAEKLVDRGYAYEKLRSVYFDISRLDDYGVLSNIDLTKVQHSRTVDEDDYEKDNPVDFTLLKRSNLAELKKGIYFKTRWGNVRPSWHLECAAISLKYLADTFDIHISGSDIVFPHCENVMAIGKAATGEKLANFWLNSELVMREGKKMSRSLNNTFTMEDLEKRGYTGKEIRYFLLSSHYRKPLNFSFGAIDTASNTIRRLNNFVQRLIRSVPGNGCDDVNQSIYDFKNEFSAAMDDDFNVSGALAAVFEFVKEINPLMTQKRLSEDERDRIIGVMKEINAVIGVIDFGEERLGERAYKLLSQREEARRSERWEESDLLRDRLSDMGILVHDTPDGTTWTLK
ncbi:MAG: cysteine--tRNA ligase, partial [Thermodesulfobacteriota bacterium]|nr:cysteine--tRNA ligase [Thermodesulfobacteriota bacterium]